MSEEDQKRLNYSYDFGCYSVIGDSLEKFDPVSYFKIYKHYEEYNDSKIYSKEPFQLDDGYLYENRLVRIVTKDEHEERLYVIYEEIVSETERVALEPFCQCYYCVGDWRFWQRPCAHCVGCLSETNGTTKGIKKARDFRDARVLQAYESTKWLFSPFRVLLLTMVNLVALVLLFAGGYGSPAMILSFSIVASFITINLLQCLVHDSHHLYKTPSIELENDLMTFGLLSRRYFQLFVISICINVGCLVYVFHNIDALDDPRWPVLDFIASSFLVLPLMTGLKCLYRCLYHAISVRRG